MWKASTTRISWSLQALRCRRQFSLTKQKCAKGDQRVAYNPPPPPPGPPLPPVRSGRTVLGTVFKIVSVSTIGVGGVLTYAWFDPGFRSTLEDTVPYSKEVMETLFAFIPESTSKPPEREGKPKKMPSDDAKPLRFSERKKATEEEILREIAEEKPEAAVTTTEEKQKLLAKKRKEREEEEMSENAAMEVILENILIRVGETAEAAVEAQRRLVDATRRHSYLLKTAMDDKTEILDKDRQWQSVKEAYKDRESLAAEAEEAVSEARTQLDYLKAAIEDGKSNKVTRRNKTLTEAQESFTKVSSDLRTATAEVNKAESDGRMVARYKELIERGRQQFAEELDTLMPDVKLGRRAKKLTEEELNALIAHAHRRIEQLQRQLAEQMALESQRVEKALDIQKSEDEKLTVQRVNAEAQRLTEKFNFEKQQWDAEARVEFETELRQQLARQAAAHSDHLKDVLRVQAVELEQQCERELHKQLLQERQAFQTEVAGWIARLKGIESAVEARAESEKIARVAQDLWLACIALNGIIRHGNEADEWEARMMPMRKEVEAISDAGGKHPFVETLIQTIPDHVLDRGIWTEDSLRERFPKVNRVCRRVAMIDETGGTLFKYFLSYLQSFFVFDSVYAKSEKDEIDPDKLDTFSILGHAEYWLERGDLEMALRFMNQLKGEPRRVASDWIQEARLLLETRQAAYALTAFASASGLGTIF